MVLLDCSSFLLKTSLWERIIENFYFIKNYAWAIILFVICLKLVLIPLDVIQKRSAYKNGEAQKIIQPEIEKINKLYPNVPNDPERTNANTQRRNAETMKVYKKNGINPAGMCLPMLISLVVTMVIFFTLYASLNTISNKKTVEQISELNSVYEEIYEARKTEVEESYIEEIKNKILNNEDENYNNTTDEEPDKFIYYEINEGVAIFTEKGEKVISEYVETKIKEDIKLEATKQVLKTYDELKDRYSWIWVKNVFRPDTAASQLLSYSDYKVACSSAEVKPISSDRYETIKNMVYSDDANSGWNGLFILVVLAGVVSFVTQKISNKFTNQNAEMQQAGMMRIMTLLMPILMVIFAISSSALFSLYIILNSVMSCLITIVISLIMNAIHKNKISKGNNGSSTKVLKKKGNTEVVEYSRNYNKGE